MALAASSSSTRPCPGGVLRYCCYSTSILLSIDCDIKSEPTVGTDHECNISMCFLCPTGALQQPGSPPGLGHQPQRVQIPPADHTSRSNRGMAGRLQPAGQDLWRNTVQSFEIKPKTWSKGGQDLDLDLRANKDDSSLHSCSLSFRAGGCGLTVRVSITPTGTPRPPPAATFAPSYAPAVSPPVCFGWPAAIVKLFSTFISFFSLTVNVTCRKQNRNLS